MLSISLATRGKYSNSLGLTIKGKIGRLLGIIERVAVIFKVSSIRRVIQLTSEIKTIIKGGRN